MSFILSIDQGTSGTKAIIFDSEGKALAKATEPLKSYFSAGGFVEQDPEEIFQNVLLALGNCIKQFKDNGGEIGKISCCGISNQRESLVLWDDNGKPLHNAVIWQCKRSIEICQRLKHAGNEENIKSRTGLIIDPYFSATKVMWLYENDAAVKSAIDSGEAYFGTIDTWLLYKLTNGNYFTDHTNASRTLFFNLDKLEWDEELLNLFGLQNLKLPQIKSSDSNFGESDFNGLFDHAIQVTAMIGDSHAAAFGEGCGSPGTAKATLGTGSSILMNIGDKVKHSEKGMVTTVCWSMSKRLDYAFEGVIVSCGSTIEWLKNELNLLESSSESEKMALSVENNNGVYLVPAFSGLGAPHWDMERRASITGLTFGSGKNHIVRAALESIAYQIKDVIDAMEIDSGIKLKRLMVDGGITSNKFLLQFIADLLEIPVVNIGIADVSALGAAYLAGLSAGIFVNLESLRTFNTGESVTTPNGNKYMSGYYEGWKKAIKVN